MKISFTIPKSSNGAAVMEVDGVKGPACLKATKALREKLAAGTGGLKRKPEFREVSACRNQNVS